MSDDAHPDPNQPNGNVYSLLENCERRRSQLEKTLFFYHNLHRFPPHFSEYAQNALSSAAPLDLWNFENNFILNSEEVEQLMRVSYDEDGGFAQGPSHIVNNTDYNQGGPYQQIPSPPAIMGPSPAMVHPYQNATPQGPGPVPFSGQNMAMQPPPIMGSFVPPQQYTPTLAPQNVEYQNVPQPMAMAPVPTPANLAPFNPNIVYDINGCPYRRMTVTTTYLVPICEPTNANGLVCRNMQQQSGLINAMSNNVVECDGSENQELESSCRCTNCNGCKNCSECAEEAEFASDENNSTPNLQSSSDFGSLETASERSTTSPHIRHKGNNRSRVSRDSPPSSIMTLESPGMDSCIDSVSARTTPDSFHSEEVTSLPIQDSNETPILTTIHLDGMVKSDLETSGVQQTVESSSADVDCCSALAELSSTVSHMNMVDSAEPPVAENQLLTTSNEIDVIVPDSATTSVSDSVEINTCIVSSTSQDTTKVADADSRIVPVDEGVSSMADKSEFCSSPMKGPSDVVILPTPIGEEFASLFKPKPRKLTKKEKRIQAAQKAKELETDDDILEQAIRENQEALAKKPTAPVYVISEHPKKPKKAASKVITKPVPLSPSDPMTQMVILAIANKEKELTSEGRPATHKDPMRKEYLEKVAEFEKNFIFTEEGSDCLQQFLYDRIHVFKMNLHDLRNHSRLAIYERLYISTPKVLLPELCCLSSLVSDPKFLAHEEAFFNLF